MDLPSVFILLFVICTTATSSFADNLQTYKIENIKSGLVLDGSDQEVTDGSYYQVTIQHDSKSDFQRWYLEPGDFGTFHIVNYGTRKAMALTVTRRIGASVVTRLPNQSSSLQKWHINSDGTIVNAGNHFAAVVYMGRVNAGSALVGHHKRGINNQHFRLIKFP